MTDIPLILRLRKQLHKDIAAAQDIIVREMYRFFDKAVLHGGTAIWRCYNGNRFSEDVDAYLRKDEGKLDSFFDALERNGLVVEKRKISKRSLFSVLKSGRTTVRFEAIFKTPLPRGFLKEYATSNGNMISVYTLTPEELIKEKVQAYTERLKIRDLYDIFFLARYVKDKKDIFNDLEKLKMKFKRPADEKDLKVLIIDGIVPDSQNMIEYLRRF